MNDNKNKLPYKVPSDYFNNLTTNIWEGVQASGLDSLENTDFLENIPKVNPYSIPIQYFDHLSNNIADIVTPQELNLNNGAKLNTPYEVPNEYFEVSLANIHELIFESDKDLVDLNFLESIGKENLYSVPDHYFESFEVLINNNKQQVNVPSLTVNKSSKTKWTNNWLAAASILFIFSIGGVWMIGSDNPINSASKSYNSAQLASVTLDNVSDADINTYIEEDIENFDLYSLMDNANLSSVSKIGKGYLDNVSKEDIEAYLEYEGI